MKVGDEIMVIVTGNIEEGFMEPCKVIFIAPDPYYDRTIMTLLYNDSTGNCWLEDIQEVNGKYYLTKEK